MTSFSDTYVRKVVNADPHREVVQRWEHGIIESPVDSPDACLKDAHLLEARDIPGSSGACLGHLGGMVAGYQATRLMPHR